MSWFTQRWQAIPALTTLWNRGLPGHTRITHHLSWPLWLLPIALVNQLITPHPIWIVTFLVVAGVYAIGYYWVRSQAKRVTLTRKRVGTLLVAGDALREEFEVSNASELPVLWAEFVDASTLPGYNPGRVVAASSQSSYRWHADVICQQRGLYQLGPHRLILGDPFHLFSLELDFAQRDVVLIYPRVAYLPPVILPQGSASGGTRRQRPLWGGMPATSVRGYQPTDSLRYVHWPLTAHRNTLMVRELEIEPSGAVWIVLDLNAAAHHGSGSASTLEYSVIVAASLAAELLTSAERRAVGLLLVSGSQQAAPLPIPKSVTALAPQQGQARLWEILAALAPVQPTSVTLAELLRTHRAILGQRSTLVVITAQQQIGQQVGENGQADDWLAELAYLRALGLPASVVLITGQGEAATVTALREQLARQEISLQSLQAGTPLRAALTFRRTRRVIRNTPTGGAISFDVEEEVG